LKSLKENISSFWFLWSMLLLGALFAAGNAVLFMTVDGVGGAEFKNRFLESPVFGWSHTMGGAFAILIGPFQFIRKLRARYPRVHRWTGRMYLIAVLTSAVSGLYFAQSSATGRISGLGFGVLAVLWIATATMAYRTIRSGNVPMHQYWMIRNYALTFAAATLRIQLVMLLMAGLSFPTAFQFVSWSCWITNIAFVEYYTHRSKSLSYQTIKGELV
jgi:uncharacterized membrane protein